MRNWTIKEAVEVIKAGTDAEAIKEIARINPLFVVAVAKDDVATIAGMMGEKFTVRRLEVNGVTGSDDTEDGAMNPPTTEAEVETGAEDLEAMSTKQLMALCDKRGIKVPKYGKNKQFYLDALQNAGNTTATTEEDAEEDATATTEDVYEGKSAMELFKECKKRGIKAEQKKPAKYYIGLLKKADEAEAEVEAEDEGWEDDEVEEAPKAKPAKAPKATKPAKASKAKAEVEAEDDDEEWDI